MRLVYPEPPVGDAGVGLRAWTLDDVTCIRAAAEDPRIPAHTSLPPEYTPDAARAFIRRQWEHNAHGAAMSLAIVESPAGVAVGSIFLSVEERTVTLGYWVVPAARRRGLGTRAVELLAGWLLAQPDVDRVEAIVRADNTSSIRLLASAGFGQGAGPEHAPNLLFFRSA